MAKVIMPLMSGNASGKMGGMVFQKNNVVRNLVIPANPQTTDQMAQRNLLKDIQAELKVLGTKLRGELKSGFGARWNSMIIGELLATDHAVLDTLAAEYTAFIAGDKTAWTGVDGVTPVVRQKGELLYIVASATKDIAIRLGVVLTLTTPSNANSATVGPEWTAAA